MGTDCRREAKANSKIELVELNLWRMGGMIQNPVRANRGRQNVAWNGFY
jgi:hypothetical protein